MASVASGYSRQAPSAGYRRLLSQYQQMHQAGERFLDLPPEQTFAGMSLLPHASRIAQLVAEHQARTLLDYGSGKGDQYRTPLRSSDGRSYASLAEFWNIESITCYDPGYAPFCQLPEGTFDGVISTDVLEHCPEDDVPWIVEEMFSYARRFVYANVACYPAKKRLPTGENAHCTIKPPEWWQGLLGTIAARHPGTRYEFALDLADDDGRPARKALLRG